MLPCLEQVLGGSDTRTVVPTVVGSNPDQLNFFLRYDLL